MMCVLKWKVYQINDAFNQLTPLKEIGASANPLLWCAPLAVHHHYPSLHRCSNLLTIVVGPWFESATGFGIQVCPNGGKGNRRALARTSRRCPKRRINGIAPNPSGRRLMRMGMRVPIHYRILLRMMMMVAGGRCQNLIQSRHASGTGRCQLGCRMMVLRMLMMARGTKIVG